MSIHDTLTNNFRLKTKQRDETVFKLCHCYCLSICLILAVFGFGGAKLHFRSHKLSAFWHTSLLNKLCQIFERYSTKYVFSLTHTPPWFAINTNRLRSYNSQERKIRFKIDPFTKCQTHTVKKHTLLQYIPALNTRYVIHLFSYTDTLFEWSQMKIIKLEFPIIWYETFFYV